ncbi:monocarboxylate transporter 2-like isoform X2 [Chrysoperla carnea]|nr:monocarboxylate transporter 2-like isoform X2 [Chrysoperla carnea]
MNGPLFRAFTYRKVSLFGATICFLSIVLLAFTKTFPEYIVVFSIFYGIGMGFTLPANSIALNTYFNKKRRIATGYSWTITALGPVIMPHLIRFLLNQYEVEGTVLIFAGIAAHAIVCACLLHPVHWHTKFRNEVELKNVNGATIATDRDQTFVSLENENEHELSKLHKNGTIQTVPTVTDKDAFDKLEKNDETENLMKNNHEKDPKVRTKPDQNEKKSCWHSIILFFELDLLKDLIFLNIMMGVTVVYFVEFNFSILTPFVLKDYNFDKLQTANFMSMVATVDIIVRFTIPFASAKVNWDNRTFFMIGIMCIAFGRILLIITKSYSVSLPIAALIGFGKGIRTIFMALVIPSHVPLTRLPAATGLQLLAGGFTALALGPIVGLIRDKTQNYTLTLHFLNILTFAITISWTIEKFIRRYKDKQNKLKTNMTQS